ncbi:3-oxoadipate enol-lactonase 2 [Marinomonas spartinae]|uniref:3-oxoadipate enol-lactonase 2 n=1 Tax=Marinomonas spartinae TaxID=1792290 RepID=A0A1A8THS2_9GAMM|nr:alpha/beta fold hydrolase [Marinomonas spartinae]SBS33136.1 3-oxoadipate enol-lactonase 2 [Marinomonas spartinae]SBS34947.1 3-oxoadipate enol-lactonase 2 [Marinomonas spartinae]
MKKLFFTLEGDSNKPTIVLGHPLGMNSRVWDGIVPELLKQFRVVRWDLPGHGLSDALDPSTSPLTENALINPLIEKCDELGIKQFHYVGTSIAGMIGQQLVTQYPERLLSATLTNTGAKIGTKEAWLNRQKDVMAQGLESMAATLVVRWFSENSVQTNPTLASYWQEQLAKVDDFSYGALCAWLANMDLTDELEPSSLPVQLICGEKDVATTPELMETLASLLQVNKLEIIEKIGHVPSVESPAQFLALLKSFIHK